MPGSTPIHGFPYPVDLDPIDVAGDIQTLAEAIDGAFSIAPAEAGPQQADASVARFGHVATSGDMGYMVRPDGIIDIRVQTQFNVVVNGASIIEGLPTGVGLYGNNGRLSIGDAVQANCSVISAYNPVTNDWANGHFVGYSSTRAARAVLNGFGSGGQYCGQLRVDGISGVQVDCVNLDSSAWAALGASAFVTNSTLDSKRDVQPLSDDITHTTSTYDPASDTVAQPDILALRPVTFRPAVGVSRIVPAGDEINIDPGDPATWTTEPADGVIGAEGNRERLGLVAEEVATVVPSAVTHGADGAAIGIDYAQITVALLDHVQRLTERIAVLEGAAP